MKSILLTTISKLEPDRPPGFGAELYSAGRIVHDTLELADADWDRLDTKYHLDAPPEPTSRPCCGH